MDINFSKTSPLSARPKPPPVFSKRPSSWVELGILFLIAALFYWFMVMPKISQTRERKARAEALESESAELGKQQQKFFSLVDQLKDSSKDIKRLDESLPLHPRNTWVYILIDNLVQSSGMSVSSLSVNNVDQSVIAGQSGLIEKPFSVPRVLKKMTANLAVTGSFVQFQALLKKLEESSRIIDVRVLEITASTDELLDFRLSFDTYYFAP